MMLQAPSGVSSFNEVALGGGKAKIEKHHAKGKMTARERIDFLLDEETERIEIGAFAGDEMYEEYENKAMETVEDLASDYYDITTVKHVEDYHDTMKKYEDRFEIFNETHEKRHNGTETQNARRYRNYKTRESKEKDILNYPPLDLEVFRSYQDVPAEWENEEDADDIIMKERNEDSYSEEYNGIIELEKEFEERA